MKIDYKTGRDFQISRWADRFATLSLPIHLQDVNACKALSGNTRSARSYLNHSLRRHVSILYNFHWLIGSI